MNTSGDSNRSVRFTKARIREAFFTLLKEKSIHKISVSELVKKANVSRATFYVHYLDIYHLMEKIESDIINQIIGEISKFDESSYVVGEYPIAKQVFTVLQNHSEEIRLLTGENGDAAFRVKFQTALSDYFRLLLGLIIKKPQHLDPVLSFLIGGVLNMFLDNINSKNPQDIETLAMISNRYLRVTNKLIGLPEAEPDI